MLNFKESIYILMKLAMEMYKPYRAPPSSNC